MTHATKPRARLRGRRFAADPPAPMDAAGLIAARQVLGLTAAALGRALGLEGRDTGQSVRLWETGRAVPGPVRVAVRYMLAEHARAGLQEAPEPALAVFPDPPTRTPESPPEAAPEAAAPAPLRTRRRAPAL